MRVFSVYLSVKVSICKNSWQKKWQKKIWSIGSFNGQYKILHSFRRCLFHSIGRVTINIEGKCCRRVTEIGLDGFDLVSVLECETGVSVSEVMDAAFGYAHSRGDFFYNGYRHSEGLSVDRYSW